MIKRRLLSVVLMVVMVLSLIPTNIIKRNEEVKAASSGTRVVGYFPSYRMETLNSIDFSALTHCILSFMTYSNGTLTSGFSAYDVQNIVSKCHSNGVKAMIAIGGWNGFNTSDNPFGTAEKRTSIINQVMSYVDTYNLDGVDLDIEVTDANVWNNFDAFVSELSGRLKSMGKLLTMAVSTWFTGPITNSTYQYFDFLNLMSYDYNQAGTGDHAPWQQIYDMVSYYGNRGVSNDKLVIGVPFYGYGSGGTAYTYGQMVSQNAGNAELDYANGVYYNGRSTIRKKAEYSKSYGGTMIWEIGQDSFGTYSLLNVIKEVMATGGGAEPTTQAPADGMSECIQDQNVTVGAWGYYVGAWSPATARYSGGASLNDFTLKVTSNNGQAWGVQAFTAPIDVKAGSTYNVSITLNSDAAGAKILFKDDITDAVIEEKTLVAGDNVFAGTFTAADTAAFFFDFANVSAGTTLKVTSFSLTETSTSTEQPTSAPTTGNVSWTAIANSTTFSYANADNMTVVNIQSPEWAASSGIYMYTTEGVSYVSINGTRVGSESVAIDGAGVVIYESSLTAEISTVTYHRVDGSIIASVDIKNANASGGEQPTEAPTEVPTEQPAINTNAEVEINGCQVSTTTEGYRIVYSISDTDNEVASVGMVYGLADHVTKDEMVANSTNSTVYIAEATENGKLNKEYSSMANAQSYAMTMKFVKTAEFFNQKLYVRAYAKLNTGEYIYSDVNEYVMYEVADYLYKNQLMNNLYGHDYLYNEILNLVNPSYQKISYKFSNILA